jgi:integrase
MKTNKTTWEAAKIGDQKIQGLFIRRPGESFYARITVNGKRTFRKLKSTKISAAAKECKELQIGFVRAVSTRGIDTLHAAMTETMEFRKVRKITRELRPRSVAYNEEILKEAKKLFRDVPLAHITEQSALSEFSRCKFSASRKRALFQLLKGTLARAVESGVISKNPLAGHIPEQTKIKKRELPTREQLEQIIAIMPEVYPKSGRSIALSVRFLAFSGMRIEEAGKCKWSDYRNDRLRVAADTKTGERFIDVNPPLKATLDEISEVLGSDPSKVIIPVRRILEQLKVACDKLGLAPLDHHDLRAWFITWCLNNGVDVKTISDWCGNSPNVLLTRYASIQEAKKIELASKLS